MFFELAQFFKFFLVSPITWMAACLLAGICLKSAKHQKTWMPRTARSLFLASAILFAVFTNPWLQSYVDYKVTASMPTSTLKQNKKYRAAIVMGGFGGINKENGQLVYSGPRAARLWEAVRLYKSGIVEYIIITGDGSSQIDENGETSAPLFLKYMAEAGVPKEAFILEQHALNTKQNAEFTARILRQRGFPGGDCVLITTGSHMQRSLDAFARNGVHPDYLMVEVHPKPENFSHRALYPRWDAAVQWERIFNEWIGNIVYKL